MAISISAVEVNNDKKVINSWAFYDWANSVYPLVINSAIFPVFYENITSVRDGKTVNDTVVLFGTNFHNTELYSYVIALSFLIVSITSPFLSGIADFTGSKKRFMQFFCYMGAISCASLYFFNPDRLALSLVSVMLASIGFWGSLVFYNAFLPEIAPPERHDQISAKGYSLGYLGSSLLLIFILVVIMNYDFFGFQKSSQPVRLSFLAVGLWWIGFSQFTFSRLPSNIYNKKPQGNILTKGYMELKKVWLELKETPRLKSYLQAFFVYSMGVQTVMLMAVLFAKKEIKGMEDGNLIISVIIIQFIGMGGAYLFAFLSSKLGNIKALMIAVFIWICLCAGTYLFVYEASHFYIVAAVVGLIMGGIQSLSRSTYAKMLPVTTDHASYFSFYEVTEKTAIVIGMFSFGFIEGVTGSMRNSIFALITFFIIGFLLLLRVPYYKHIKPLKNI
jgi:MFS transporter, UMF1 family